MIYQKEEIFSKLKIKEVYCIVHLASYIPKGNDEDPYLTLTNNVLSSINLLEFAKDQRVKRMIYSSSMSIYNTYVDKLVKEGEHINPKSLYSISKLESEYYCKYYSEKYGIFMIILRYGGVYGNRKNAGAVYNFIRLCLDNKNIILEHDGIPKCDFTYVDDINQANLKAIQRIDSIRFGIFNIGSGEGISVKDLANKIRTLTNSSSKIIKSNKKEDYNLVMDITKAKAILGYVPGEIEDNLKKYINIIKNKKK